MIGKEQKFKRALLWLPAKLYELAVRLRVVAYETAYLKPKRLNATVISVGNITLGGTGKTPMVEYIARYLKEEGYSVVILTRGYGRKSSGRRVLNHPASAAPESASYLEFGDEPLMLAQALPDVPIVIQEDRYEGGQWAEREIEPEVIVLDDAYQHLQLARDLNMLLLDATDPFGGFDMVPFGRLREPLYGLKRADAVIVTRADRPFDQAQTNAIIKYSCGEKVPVMYAYSVISSLRHLATGEAYEASQFAGWDVAVLCGIGNPQAFSDDLLRIGMNVTSEHFFADHHAYTQEEVDEVIAAARRLGADAIITTEKDAMRLEGIRHGDVPIYSAHLEIQSDDEVRLKSLLLRTCLQRRNRRSG
ncbi:MAG TPA: tetraacyldisaccharide 4'-kinase [Blastocatellia bacterium]|nr:tetraacyldisaccharide 4'-kinase [Blastocatellia bacterium]